MANKLPWTTPKVQTLYTTSSVGRLIAEYLDAIVLDGLVSGDDHRKNDKYPHIIT